MKRPVNDNASDGPFTAQGLAGVTRQEEYVREVFATLTQAAFDNDGLCGNPVWMDLIREWKARVDPEFAADWDQLGSSGGDV